LDPLRLKNGQDSSDFCVVQRGRWSIDLTNIGTLFAFILVCMGIMILRIKDPDRDLNDRK
jgi:amino acid transporter